MGAKDSVAGEVRPPRVPIDLLPDRITAALLGAAAAEAIAGAPAGARQLLELAESLADKGGFDEADAVRRGLDAAPATGRAGLILRAVPIGLLTPLDRPRLRRTAHRVTMLGGADEGTAMAAVATACLAADLTRFDLTTALVRLRQTLLEEAPMALLSRLVPLAEGTPRFATGDPVDTLQLAISAVGSGTSLPATLDEAATFDGDSAAAVALAGALAGAAFALDGADEEWQAEVPARARVEAVAAALSGRAVALLP